MNPIAKNLIKAAVAVGALKGAYKLGKIAGAGAAYRQNHDYAEPLTVQITPRLTVEVGPGFVTTTVVTGHDDEDAAVEDNLYADDEHLEDEA